MDTTKVLVGVLIAAIAVFAIILVAPAFLSGKSPAASFAWKEYGYDPEKVCRYDIASRKYDQEDPTSERKALVIRITVPKNAEFKHVKTSLLDAVKRTTTRDKRIVAVTALAYYDGDEIPSAHFFTAGKAVWGPGGKYTYGVVDAPYELHFYEPVKRNRPRGSFTWEYGGGEAPTGMGYEQFQTSGSAGGG